MKGAIKYRILTISAVLVFVYICSTEITDRFGEIIEMHTQLKQKEAALLTPEKFAEKKQLLKARVGELTRSLFTGEQTFHQSSTGIVEFLGACAKKSNLHFESLTPSGAKTANGINEIGFKISSIARYDQVGHFVNAMESGPISIRLKKLELHSKSPGLSSLMLDVEGAAFLLKK